MGGFHTWAYLPLKFVRFLVDVLAFELAIGRTLYMRVRGRRKPIRNWPKFAASLWWYIRTTNAEHREAQVSHR